MVAVGDLGWYAVGIALIALFAWYFWHTAKSMISSMRLIHEYLDTRSERLRRRLEHEAIHGRPPLWYRAAQKLMILIIIAGCVALMWMKVKGA